MLGMVGGTGVGTVVLWLGALTVFFARGDVNVARGKSYSQSSLYNSTTGGTQTGPDAAANGDTSPHFPANGIHTREDADHYMDHPWYEVNLGRTYPLHRIDLWARGRFKHRLYPSTITVDNETCTTVTTNTTTSMKEEVTCSAIMYGQRVRITLDKTTQSLNLCEMEIWVPDGVSNCSAGKYGPFCDLNCSENCGQGPGKNFCDQSSAECYGDTVTKDALSQHCEAVGELTKPVLSGSDGPSTQDVVSFTENNIGCVDGWYGDQCSTACSPGCPNQQCGQESGECSPCNTGYTGDTCTDCQDNYYQTTNGTCTSCSSNCQSQSCASPTGRCNGCEDGRYGEQCERPCPAANCQQCEQDTGECTQCALDSNLLLPNCTDCPDNFYERSSNTGCDECTWSCQSGTVCDKTTGHCPVCPPGKQGHHCDEDCEPGRYGQNCTGQCGHCLLDHLNKSCEAVTGNCTYGCQDGWLTTLCNEECADGRWGTGCVETCGQCRDGVVCRTDNGRCPLCEPGWYSPLCDTPCQEGWYGNNCSQQCGSCKNDVICNRTTGHCPDCTTGRQPPLCHADCQNKTYGQNCVKTCGQCRGGQPCDPVTGQCSNGCQPGWTDLTPSSTPLCQTECPDGTYGDGCNQKCGSCAQLSECHHRTGQCSGQCAGGFTGSHCTDKVEKGDNAGVIAGPVVAVLIAILIAVIVVIFVVRRRRQRAKSNALSNESAELCNNASGGAVRTPPARSGSSLLTFDAISSRNDKKEGRPQSQGKPSVSAKPHPAGADIYQNVSLADQNWVLKAAIASPEQASDKSGSGNSGKGPPGQTSWPPPGEDTSRPSGRGPLTDDEELDSMCSGEPVFANDPSYVNFQPAKYRLDQLHETILDSLRDGRPDREFGLLVGFKDFPLTNGQRQENYYKNRFKSIVPYDKNRVVLEKVGGDDASDYVNASIIKGHRTEKAYIASQGPRSNTQDDFWRMVWQEGVTDIVMLTNVKEGNKRKCHAYWPEKGKSLNTGHVEVTGLQEKERANFVICSFTITNLQSNDRRQVRQYHYLKWMDHEVPATTPLVDFWRYVRARAPRTATAPPLLVHCSAGVGRTGTYIALDILMDQTQEEEISLFHTVDSLREDRCHMVQNKGQYEFLHEAVVEAYMSGDCRQDTSSFDRLFPHTVHHHLPHPRLDAEFERLCQMRACLPPPSHTVASLEENRHKNRHPEALPDDKHLVYITEHTKGRNQYINAVYMPTFLSSMGSIVTQLPLADTVIDLWRLVDSWDVTTIVSIGQMDGRKDTCRYWPKGKEEPVQCGPYTISLKSTSSLGGSLVSHTLDTKKKGTSREVQVLHYEAWTGEVADNVSDLLHLLDILHTSHKQSTEEPIIIQCIDGVAKSGVLCALWDVISRMTYDDDVDVYVAARHVQSVRPEAISSVVQYRFIYEVIQQYRNSKNIYANTSSLNGHE